MTDTTLLALEAATGGTPLGAVTFVQGGTAVKVGKQTLVDTLGNPLSSSAGTPNGFVITVQGNAGGVAVPVSGTVSAAQSGAWTTGRTWSLASGTDSVTIGGSLPAFAATPTVNLGTLNGAATAANQVLINTTLGSPMQQTGGSVALVAGSAAIGSVAINAPLPAGSNAIGSVAINAPLPAGSNTIGTVSVTGTVAVTQSGAWTTGRTWTLGTGTDSVTIGAALPTGTNVIGSVTQSGTWAVNSTNFVGGSAASAANPVPVQLSLANAAVSASNPVPVQQTSNYTGTFAASISFTNSSTAANAVPFAIFSPTTNTKTLYIKRIRVKALFTGTTAATQISIGGYTFTGAAAPTGGTAVAIASKRAGTGAYTTVTTASYLAAGLTVTGITKGNQLIDFSAGRIADTQVTEIWDWTAADEIECPALTPGSGIAFYYNVAGTATDILTFEIEWAER